MKDLLKELQNTETELTETISSISEDNFNTVPFDDCWTPAQVTEHIMNAIGVDLLYGETKQTARRYDDKIAETAKLFLNMDIKMQSPDFIYPSGKQHTREEMLGIAKEKFDRLIQAVKTLDLSLTCTVFEIPGFGEFTRLEFVWFYIFHTQRHIFQLKNIAKVLAG
ncbi:MAG: hypothetical protein JWR50_3647 [Mucilaginibacter sp.]|nr:hypothetical protein [Mucilaginibacter sp.]